MFISESYHKSHKASKEAVWRAEWTGSFYLRTSVFPISRWELSKRSVEVKVIPGPTVPTSFQVVRDASLQFSGRRTDGRH